jgi:hypothetical protein
MLIDYIKLNDLHQYLDIILLNFLKNENTKVSPEYMEQLISYHKLNMLNSRYMADDIVNLISNI